MIGINPAMKKRMKLNMMTMGTNKATASDFRKSVSLLSLSLLEGALYLMVMTAAGIKRKTSRIFRVQNPSANRIEIAAMEA